MTARGPAFCSPGLFVRRDDGVEEEHGAGEGCAAGEAGGGVVLGEVGEHAHAGAHEEVIKNSAWPE